MIRVRALLSSQHHFWRACNIISGVHVTPQHIWDSSNWNDGVQCMRSWGVQELCILVHSWMSRVCSAGGMSAVPSISCVQECVVDGMLVRFPDPPYFQVSWGTRLVWCQLCRRYLVFRNACCCYQLGECRTHWLLRQRLLNGTIKSIFIGV